MSGAAGSCGSSAPAVAIPGTPVTVLCPSPQQSSTGGQIVSFAGWTDGSNDNPRTFLAGSTASQLLASFKVVTTPYVTPAGVTNSGSYASNGVSPGELVTLFGFNFGLGGNATIQNGKFPTTISGTSVLF